MNEHVLHRKKKKANKINFKSEHRRTNPKKKNYQRAHLEKFAVKQKKIFK